MKNYKEQKLQFEASKSSGNVSASLIRPPDAEYLMVLAHGAGAGMSHRFMEHLAKELAKNQVATFRFNFPYIEQGRRAPGPPAIAQKTIFNAIEKCVELELNLPVFIGGKSYGGRMSSQMMASNPHPSVKGVGFFGFPLHAPGKPSVHRAEHLKEINVPILFLQGTRDTLGQLNLIEEVVDGIKNYSTLEIIEGADHSFHVLKSSGTNDVAVLNSLSEKAAGWMQAIYN